MVPQRIETGTLGCSPFLARGEEGGGLSRKALEFVGGERAEQFFRERSRAVGDEVQEDAGSIRSLAGVEDDLQRGPTKRGGGGGRKREEEEEDWLAT